MLIRQNTVLDFLGAPDAQLIVPVYQRVYAWSDRQCDALWADVRRAGRADAAHFLGTVLYAPESGTGAVGCRLDVIDGQQRLATLTLLLAALRDHLRDAGLALEGVDAREITERYLHVAGEPGAGKLVLSRADHDTLTAVIEGAELPGADDVSANVVANYERFRAKMDAGFAAADAEELWRGLRRLTVITAELEGGDRPQLVFESLNSKGMPLATADLVRNLLLARAGYDEQTRLYERYWAPVEKLYEGDGGSLRLNAALHGWLAVTAPQVRVGGADEVYDAFKAYLDSAHQGTLEELLIGLKGFCETFAAKSQSSGAARVLEHASWANGKVEGIISEKKLFGD